MRIHVTGNAGAGKTTLAHRLERALGIPSRHMDQVVWKSGWRKPSTEERRDALRAIMQDSDWVIEGVSRKVREEADIVVFLDVPRRVCLWRCAKRTCRHLFKSRPELPAGCPEWKIIPTLVGIIWRFPRVAGDRISAEALGSRRYFVLRDRDDVEQWLNEFLSASLPGSSPSRTSDAVHV